MPDHEDSLGGETFSSKEQLDPAEQSLGDGAAILLLTASAISQPSVTVTWTTICLRMK
jgi:hypothetical protein